VYLEIAAKGNLKTLLPTRMVLVHLNDTIMKLLLKSMSRLQSCLEPSKSEAYKQYVVHSLTEKYKVARQMRNFVIKQF
jgi:hypothetical protein